MNEWNNQLTNTNYPIRYVVSFSNTISIPSIEEKRNDTDQ